MSDQTIENQTPEDQGNEQETAPEQPPHQEELRCVACGHPIEQDDLECPNCGISLVAG